MKTLYKLIRRQYATQSVIKPKICVVGSGPAGFYAAQHLLKIEPSVEIDIYEKLPVPFGLVRFGVAPDHPEVKNVINTFTKTAENPNVQFYGNVNLGKDVSLKELRDAYQVVLLTYGADENRKLNIPGEDLENVIAARNIVGWYNGVPSDRDLKIDLSGPVVAIFGQGNVAIDVARILLTPVDNLKKTDITDYALEALANSKVKEVNLIGRRGPLQAAYTIKELREMLKLQDCKTCWNSEDFHGIKDVVPSLARPKKRIIELMLKSVSETTGNGRCTFKPVFFRSPLEILGTGRVEKVKLGINKLVGEDMFKQLAVLTNNTELLQCNLAVTSIGYKSIQVDADIPFDCERGITKNINSKIDNGLYATGWVGTGPMGVILTTMSNAFGTAELISFDLQKTNLEIKPGYESIRAILQRKGVQVVTWRDWLKIDSFEQEMGKKVGKPREKVVNINKMLEIASC